VAFGRELVTDPEAEGVIRERYGDRTNSYRLEMARIPRGSQLIRNKSFAAPGFRIENVYVFPGVPQLMQEMFDQMEQVLIRIGFLSQSNPGHIMRSIRRFLGKAELTERDVQIVRGIMSQMDWYIRQGKDLKPHEIRKP
jgi:molybdopterin-biosynthesis enzyme MoeA-like protein